MAWSAVIQNIVTEADLSTELSNYYTSTQVDADLATKLNQNGGTANNLKLTGIGTDPTSAIAKANLDAEITTINASIASKASLSGATFTGAVTVPTAVSAGHAVRLEQLGSYLEKSGGTISGPIVYAPAPSDPTHLANKSYVDSIAALKADITYVNSELATKANTTSLTSKMDVAGGTFTGYVQLLEPSIADNSTVAATTSFVNTRLAADLASKADIASPTLSNPTFTGTVTAPTPITADNSTKVATTAYVTNELANVAAVKANITSPTFLGVPAAPTALPTDNSTQLATTAFVKTAILTKAELASPAFTGTPTAPTAPLVTDSDQIATTAWVRDLLTDLGVIV